MKWEGGQVSPCPILDHSLFDPPCGDAQLQDTDEMESAQDCRATSVDAHVRFGSLASHRYAHDARGRSAMPPIATELVPRNEPSRCAN